MRSVTLLHTSQLRPEELGACRALCEGAFDGEFSPEDWDHAQGGLHVLVRDGHALVWRSGDVW